MRPLLRHRPLIAAVVACLLLTPLLGPVSATAQTPEIEEARKKAEEAAQALSDAESALGALDSEIAVLEKRKQVAEAELASLSESLKDVVIAQYTSAGDMPVLNESNINDGVKADAYARYVGKGRLDTIDAFTKAKQQLDASSAELAEKRAEQESIIDSREQAVDDLEAQLKRMEELERKRQEEAARRAAEEKAARQQAAAAAAQQSNNASSVDVRVQAADAPVPAAPAAVPAAAPETTSGGGMVCPVAGPHSFIDSWGYPRSGGRTHKGVDIMASSGTPAVAPVSGTVTHRGNSLGGLSYYLDGDDGNFYYGTHLSAYGQGGHVSAGTTIGYVGSTGNAGTPHLHFEIHPGASSYSTPVNPYPATRSACG